MAAVWRIPLLAVALLVGSVPLSPAANDPDFIDFQFRQLRFDFHPEGIPPTSQDAPEGSALLVYIVNVTIEGFKAMELRYCIDEQPDCPQSYRNLQGNQDGVVTAEEVQSYSNLVTIFAKGIPKVRNLTDLLETNVTVDGRASADIEVTAVRFMGAEGDINGTAPLEAHVDVVSRYDNDPGADRHEIRAVGLDLLSHGFTYDQVIWRAVSDNGWSFLPGETQPSSAQSRVSSGGWFSAQGTFENATMDDLRLVVESPDGGGGGSSPSPGLGIAALAIAVAVFAFRRARP